MPATAPATLGHVLICHGNGGNIGDRAPHASLLAAAGFDVLLFDYRGYGRSPGRPSEDATYADARAARAALLAMDGVDPRACSTSASRSAPRSRSSSRSPTRPRR